MSRIERIASWHPVMIALTALGVLGCEPSNDDAVGSLGSSTLPQQSRAAPEPAGESDDERPPQRRATPPATPGGRSFASAAGSEGTANAGARAEMRLIEDNSPIGAVEFSSTPDGRLEITARLDGLDPGLHGIHIHENGDCSGENASAAGDHFSPDGDPHGAPGDSTDAHHAGDLGNLTARRPVAPKCRCLTMSCL